MAGLHLEQLADDGPLVAQTGKSALDRIRDLYAKQDTEKLYLPLPRNPYMGVCYRAIDPDTFDSTATKITTAQLDILIAACECIVVRTGGPVSRDGKGWEPLLYEGEPVRFDETLNELAGLGVPSVEQGGTARQYVLAAFRKAPSPSAAASMHFEQLSDWMAGTSPVDEEALLGES